MCQDVDWDPLRLSRDLERSYERYRAFRSSLHTTATVPHPFGERPFPGKTQFDAVLQLPSDDPLRGPLARWLQFLIEERIQIPATVHESRLLRFERNHLEDPFQVEITLSDCMRRAFSAAARQRAGEAEQWWRAYERHEKPLADHRQVIWQRRVEIRERLGVTPSAFPVADPAAVCRRADEVLAETQDFADDTIQPGWVGLIQARLGLGAANPWPARLTHQTMFELLGEGALLRGIRANCFAVPERLTPSSFLLAARRVGMATAQALAPRDLPFVVRMDPAHRAGHLLGALFCHWFSSDSFARRRLGATGNEAESFVRHMELLRVAEMRTSAARVLLFYGVLKGQSALEQIWEQVSSRVLARATPPSAALARFNPAWDEPVRFQARLAARSWVDDLRESYDEDWLENPRCQEDLRARFCLPAAEVARESSGS